MKYNFGFIRFFPEFLVSFIPFYFSRKSQLKTNDEIKNIIIGYFHIILNIVVG